MQGNELLLVDSIIAGVESIFHNVMDNAAAKAKGQEHFAIFLSITNSEFQDDICIREINGKQEPLRVQSIVNSSIKSVAGASDKIRLLFKLKLIQFQDAVERNAPHELIMRFRRELRHAYIQALDDSLDHDQRQLEEAFGTVAKLSKVLNIASRTEAVDRFKHIADQLTAAKEVMAQQRQQQQQQQQEDVINQ
jgi:hypothetical protein